jgi:hypothetical protein
MSARGELTPLDRVQHALRRRDKALAADLAVRDSPAVPRNRRARAARRRVLVVDEALDTPAMTGLIEAFWDAIEAGVREVWIEFSPTGRLDRDGVRGIVHLAEFAYELDRRLVIVVPRGPEHDALRREAAGGDLDRHSAAIRVVNGMTARVAGQTAGSDRRKSAGNTRGRQGDAA